MEAAAALVQPGQVALGVAAGAIVTYLTLIACVLAVRRFGPGPLSLVLGVGLVAPLRWLGAIPILASKLRGTLQVPSNTDEGWLAALTGIPETLILLLGLTAGWSMSPGTGRLWVIGSYALEIPIPSTSKCSRFGAGIPGL